MHWDEVAAPGYSSQQRTFTLSFNWLDDVGSKVMGVLPTVTSYTHGGVIFLMTIEKDTLRTADITSSTSLQII